MIDKLLGVVVAISGGWLVALGLCSLPWVQRHIIYAHKAPITRGQQLDKPETFGFLKNQVTPLRIRTSDGESLYAWLVTPLKLYLRNETSIIAQSSTSSREIRNSNSFKLLSQDTASRLVIYFHGNAGTVGQTRRTEAYRSITAGNSDSIHVLAFDYRGFGRSTGSPTEAGLVIDAISVINWAIKEANVPPKRIVLVAQSLGTGLASAAAAHFVKERPKIEFGGLILCAPFTCAAEVFQKYRLFGSIPLFMPLSAMPFLRNWFARRIKDSWDTSNRLRTVVRNTEELRLTLLQAANDEVIPFMMSGMLFEQLIGDAAEQSSAIVDIDSALKETDLGEAGSIKEWSSGSKCIRKISLKYGGHNNIMKWAPVASEVARSFMEVTQM